MLTNIFLQKCLKHITDFKGVYSCDNVIRLKKRGECMIINFDRQNEPGSHFIAVFCENKFCISYFDSLNLKDIPKEIHDYIMSYSNVHDSSKDFQNIFSTSCGFYCMLFLYSKSISSSYWNNVAKQLLKTNNFQNDKICIDLLCKTIKKYLNHKHERK